MELSKEQAKTFCMRYTGVPWNRWIWVCRLDHADPVMDSFHEAYEHLVLKRVSGVETLDELLQLPPEKGEVLNAASHAMACLLVANQFGDPDCVAEKLGLATLPRKCRFCSVKTGVK